MAAMTSSSRAFSRPAALRSVVEGALVFGEGAVAGDGFDAAHAGGDGLLGDDLEDADFAGAVHVRAAAKLLASRSRAARRRREW